MKKVTLRELRTKAGELVKGLEQGESYALSYRNRVVGQIRPLWQERDARGEDPVYRLGAEAEDLGEGMTAAEADSLLYGR